MFNSGKIWLNLIINYIILKCIQNTKISKNVREAQMCIPNTIYTIKKK